MWTWALGKVPVVVALKGRPIMKVRGWLPSPLPSRTARTVFPYTALHRVSPSGLELPSSRLEATREVENQKLKATVHRHVLRPLWTRRLPWLALPHRLGSLRGHCGSVLRTPLAFSPDGGRRLAYSQPVSFGLLGSVPRRSFWSANRRHKVAYSGLLWSLAHSPVAPSTRLRPLCSSHLSVSVLATMSRSDSSAAPEPLVFVVSGSGVGCRSPTEAAEVSLGHARRCSHPPSANHVTGSCAGLHPARRAGPPVPPNRVHVSSGRVFGSDPSPAPSRETAVVSYRRYSICTVPPAGFEPASDVRCEAHLAQANGLGNDENLVPSPEGATHKPWYRPFRAPRLCDFSHPGRGPGLV